MNEPKNNGRIDGVDRAYRGGSWLCHSIFCRAAFRGRYAPNFRYGFLGLRLVVPVLRNKQ